MQKTVLPPRSAFPEIRTNVGPHESGVTPPFAKAPTLHSLVTDLQPRVVDPKADTDPQGKAIPLTTEDPFLPPLSYSGVFRKVSAPYSWPKIVCPTQSLVIGTLIDQITEAIRSVYDSQHPYYLDTLYQYALHYDYAEEKLRELAATNERAKKYVRALEATASAPSKAL